MASTYMNRTLTANNQKKLTISVWVKIAKVQEQMIVSSYSSGSLWGALYFAGTGQLRFYDYRSSYILKLDSNALYRDTNAWYHIVANFDCSIGSPTAKLYVNGEEVSYATQTIYSQNATTSWNTDYDFQIGKGSDLGGNNFDGQMSDLYFIQGYTYDASTFGESDSTSGIWKPKTNPTINYGGTGGNSCHLKFENSGNMDLDSGDNNVSLTTTGTLTQNVDTPSNNFATFNPLDVPEVGEKPTYSYGNLQGASTNAGHINGISSLAVETGKFYAEFKCTGRSGATDDFIGCIASPAGDLGSTNINTSASNNKTYGIRGDGSKYEAGTGSGSYSGSYAINDIIGVGLDITNNRLYFSKNGQWQNGTSWDSATPNTYITLPSGNVWHFLCGDTANSQSYTWQGNFGQGYFGITAVASANADDGGLGIMEYDVPANYRVLCTKNIKDYG